MLEPTFALLDEIDSSLDIDALKVVSKGLMQCEVKVLEPDHHPPPTFVEPYYPDVVHVMMEGRVVLSGGLNCCTLERRRSTRRRTRLRL